jgi:hypothetical protein
MADGLAGELFVAAELAKRGHCVTITFGNTKAIDIIVARTEGEDNFYSLRTIDVKSLRNRSPWAFGNRRPVARQNHFYVFCRLNPIDESPQYWILASDTVAALFEEDKESYWLPFDQIAQPQNQNWERLWQ